MTSARKRRRIVSNEPTDSYPVGGNLLRYKLDFFMSTPIFPGSQDYFIANNTAAVVNYLGMRSSFLWPNSAGGVQYRLQFVVIFSLDFSTIQGLLKLIILLNTHVFRTFRVIKDRHFSLFFIPSTTVPYSILTFGRAPIILWTSAYNLRKWKKKIDT